MRWARSADCSFQPRWSRPQAVVEGADPGAVELALGGLHEQGVARDLPEVPALPVQVDGAAVDAVGLQRQLVQGRPHALHDGARVVAHEVEAEAVDPVPARPAHHRVDHEARAQGVLRGRVGAAGRVRHPPDGVETVVVARHHPVQDAARILPAGGRVVVDLVQDHLEAQVMQGPHHLAELDDARPAVLVALGRVGALGGTPVERVVAPVVGVVVGHLRDGRLLVGRGRVRAVGDVGVALGASVLGDGGDVEGGQQVDRVHAGPGQLGQVAHARGARHREGPVGAAQLGRDGAVGGGEVPQVELVDAAGRVVADRRSLGGGPLLGGQARVGQIDGDRAGRVRRQRRRVGVGDDIGLHAPSAGHVDPHLPQVLAAGTDGGGGGARGGVGRGIGAVGHDPAAVAGAHRRGASWRAGDLRHRAQRVAGLPGQEGDGLCGGCPQGEGG